MSEQRCAQTLSAKYAPRYQRAEQLEQGVINNQLALNTTVYPRWIDNRYFWYMRQIKIGQGAGAVYSREYRCVNAATQVNSIAFDHSQLAQALAKASNQEVLATNLPISNLTIQLDPLRLNFTAFAQDWCYQAEEHHCIKVPPPVANTLYKISPDGNSAAFVKDHNLWLRDLSNGTENPLTRDGGSLYRYASAATVYGREEAPLLELVWSPDSKKLLTHVNDTRQVGIGVPLVQHVPEDGSLRPTVLNPDRRVAFPGDKYQENWQLLCIDVTNGEIASAPCDPNPVTYPPYAGFFGAARGWWDKDNRHAYLVQQARGCKAIMVERWDTRTGEISNVLQERGEHPLTLTPISHICPLFLPLPDSNELIWFSERSGWGHLYLYDLNTGQCKHPITAVSGTPTQYTTCDINACDTNASGWLVRNILHYDAGRRELWIQTAGREPKRNPYYSDICRVQIDSGELTTVCTSDDEYIVCDQRSRATYFQRDARGVSPSADYVICTRSRVDTIPETLLLDRDGHPLMTLEVADVSGLPKNWQWPEPTMVKAADGKTDLYTVIFRPSDFDPEKTYPILDCSYGYSAPIGSFANSPARSWMYLSPAAYAELGFIVVMVNGRGNDGLRDRAFLEYQSEEFPVETLGYSRWYKGDCVAAIKQLADRYSYMDIHRVGVVDFCSLPMALSAMLVYPKFYKVGVSNNPMADRRLSAAMGMDTSDYQQFEHIVHQLKGKLLLIAGMLDDVMPVSMTFRVIEALQKADKDFDMLLLPNLGHGTSGYTARRARDYIVEHLLEVKPPADFEFVTGQDLLFGAPEKQHADIATTSK